MKYLYRRSPKITEMRQPMPLDTQMFKSIFSKIRLTNVPIPVEKKMIKIHFKVKTVSHPLYLKTHYTFTKSRRIEKRAL